MIDRRLTRFADHDQRMINAPHGAEKPDERRGAADRRQHREAALHMRDGVVDAALQAARDPVRYVDAILQMRPGVAMMRGRLRCGHRKSEQRIVAQRLSRCLTTVARKAAQVPEPMFEVVGLPELRVGAPGYSLDAQHMPQLDDDNRPRQDRHDEQYAENRARDEIAALPDIRETIVLHDRFLRLVEPPRSLSAAARCFSTVRGLARSIRENLPPSSVVKRSSNELLCLNAGLVRHSAFTTEQNICWRHGFAKQHGDAPSFQP